MVRPVTRLCTLSEDGLRLRNPESPAEAPGHGNEEGGDVKARALLAAEERHGLEDGRDAAEPVGDGEEAARRKLRIIEKCWPGIPSESTPAETSLSEALEPAVE